MPPLLQCFHPPHVWHTRQNLVAEMTRPAMATLLGPEFDAFLFAPVQEEGNGALLSVLSALARMDVDPWREAAELARMPRAAANQRLTSLIAALPDAPATRLAPAKIADRLVGLLPRAGAPAATPRVAMSPAAGATVAGGAVTNMILINLLVIVGMLCAQWVLAGLQPPAPVGAVHAAASSTLLPVISQPGSVGQ